MFNSRIPIAGGNLNHDRSWFGLLNIGRSDGASEKLVAFGGYGTNGYLQSMEVTKTFFGKIEKKQKNIFFSFFNLGMEWKHQTMDTSAQCLEW